MHKRWIFTLLVIIILVTITSCIPADENDPDPLITATFTPTQNPTNTKTPSPTNTLTNTLTPTVTDIPCFMLWAPEDKAHYGAMGQINFAWTEQIGAFQYQIDISLPSGIVESKIIEKTSFMRWLESLPLGGEYTWQVIALDDSEETLCTAGPFSFSKPENVMQPSGGESNDGDGSNGGDDENLQRNLEIDKSPPSRRCPPLWGGEVTLSYLRSRVGTPRSYSRSHA